MDGKCLRLAGVLLIVIASLGLAAEPFVVIDSLAGKAEVQRAGRNQWQYIQPAAKIYNNDVVRVPGGGFVRLLFPDGSLVFVRQNSQMLVNLVQSSDGKSGLSHATVFFGAVFFVVQKALPRAWTGANQTKIYTPTAVVSLRGTSFEVGVDKNNGATGVRVISGTVLVRNILKSVSIFLSAPYQTVVEMNTDPIVPRAVLKGDIDTLRTWVPPRYVETEIIQQVADTKRDRQVITGKLADKLLFIPFVNTSQYGGNWQVGRDLSHWTASAVKRSGTRMEVVAADTALDDPRAYAKARKIRYVVLGTVELFDIVQHAEITVRADQYREFTIARVRIKMQIIDAEEDKLLGEDTFAGEVSGRNTPENSWKEIGKLKFDLKDEQFGKSILGSAVKQALDLAADKITKNVSM